MRSIDSGVRRRRCPGSDVVLASTLNDDDVFGAATKLQPYKVISK